MPDKAVCFQKGNIEDLKSKLAELLENQEEVEALRKGAREYICEKYNWDKVTEKTLQIYEK